MQHAIIYNGPSLLDGKPIVVIATYSNRNTKTGKVVQTYILRSDINPLEASKTGEDFSICGSCPMRGEVTTDPKRKIAKGRKCYVNLGQGVLIVFKSYKRGVYKEGDPRTMGRDRFVRVGTYGDPAAVPSEVWDELLAECETWTAYTHQKAMASRHCDAIRRQLRRSKGPLGRGPSHLPRDCGSWRHRQIKRDAVPCIKRGGSPRPVHSM